VDRLVLAATWLADRIWFSKATQETFGLPSSKEQHIIHLPRRPCRYNQTRLHTLCAHHLEGAQSNLLLTGTGEKCGVGQPACYERSRDRSRWLPKLSPSFGHKFLPTFTRAATFTIIQTSRKSEV